MANRPLTPFERVAARLLTGPAGHFVGGLLDVLSGAWRYFSDKELRAG